VNRFVIFDSEIDSSDFTSLQNLLSGEEITLQKSHQKSLVLLSRQLCNVGFEQLFFGQWSDSVGDISVTLSNGFTARSRVDFQSASHVSLLSVDALDDLLSSESFDVDSEDALLRILLTIKHQGLLRHIRLAFLRAETISTLFADPASFCPTEWLWRSVLAWLLHSLPLSAFGLESVIVSQFPGLFKEFRRKRFDLLWRGSRDGFGARQFHERCDGHANTLTLLLDTEGNVFGGFTPVKWESPEWNGKSGIQSNCWKSDNSLKSFVFTLKNPHNYPTTKFALKPDRKQFAIRCDIDEGPTFGRENDIWIMNDSHTSLHNRTNLGGTYTNETQLSGETVSTGSVTFTVQEIEVFEIDD
jgi:hypothetical protein